MPWFAPLDTDTLCHRWSAVNGMEDVWEGDLVFPSRQMTSFLSSESFMGFFRSLRLRLGIYFSQRKNADSPLTSFFCRGIDRGIWFPDHVYGEWDSWQLSTYFFPPFLTLTPCQGTLTPGKGDTDKGTPESLSEYPQRSQEGLSDDSEKIQNHPDQGHLMALAGHHSKNKQQ